MNKYVPKLLLIRDVAEGTSPPPQILGVRLFCEKMEIDVQILSKKTVPI